jgi:hypothetical protein
MADIAAPADAANAYAAALSQEQQQLLDNLAAAGAVMLTSTPASVR